MAYTHRILRPWSGVRAGQLVDIDTDPTKWRNAPKLISTGWLRPLTVEEQRLVADGFLPPGSSTGVGEPELKPMPKPPTPAEPDPPATTHRTVHPATDHPDQRPAPNTDAAPPTHPATTHKDDAPARVPNETVSRDDAEEARRGKTPPDGFVETTEPGDVNRRFAPDPKPGRAPRRTLPD